MTAKEMATEFVRTMNPENVTDGSANFGIYEFHLPYDNLHLEVCFVEEDFDDGNESNFRTAIDAVGKDGCTYNGVYTFAETMTDIDAIAESIEWILEKLKN